MKLKEIANTIGGSIIGNPEVDITEVYEKPKGEVLLFLLIKNTFHTFTKQMPPLL